MSDGPVMHVAWPAIRRRLRANGDTGVFVVVKVPGVKGSPGALLTDMQVAMERANAALDRDGEELVWAQAVIPSLKGPMVDLDWIGTDEQTEEWLDTFAETLTGLGWVGTVTAAPQVFFPEDIHDYLAQTRLTAYLALRMPDPHAGLSDTYGRWHGDEDDTRDLCRFATGWGALPGATVYVGESTSEVTVTEPRPWGALERATRRSAHAQLTYLLSKPYRSRSVSTGFDARMSFQSGAAPDGTPAATWTEQLPAVLEPLLHRPDRLDYGLIRPAAIFGSAIGDFATEDRTAPYVGDTVFTLNRHLWDRYVADPHGCQILTGAHLEKATDLSAWSLTEVAPDRYLVQATDLGPWWDDYDPDPQVLAKARNDFGAMLLTYDVLAADPDSWIPGRGRI